MVIETRGYDHVVRRHSSNLHYIDGGFFMREYKTGKESDAYKHGYSKTKLYGVWKRILSSCLNEKNAYFYNYGGRGITVCKEWLDINNFFSWAIKAGYKQGLEIDRIDNNGNYNPANCRFVTRQENSGIGRRRIAHKSKSGYVGVRYLNYKTRYQAYIKHNQKYIVIGSFDSIEEAIEARINFEIVKLGEQRENFHYIKKPL